MDSLKRVKVFIASPGDVVEERQIVKDVCEKLNKDPVICNSHCIHFQAEEWEDVFPAPGRAQAIINKLAYELWKSLEKPHIMFYFKEVSITSLKDLNNPQLKKVLELKDKLKDEKPVQVDLPEIFIPLYTNPLEKETGGRPQRPGRY